MAAEEDTASRAADTWVAALGASLVVDTSAAAGALTATATGPAFRDTMEGRISDSALAIRITATPIRIPTTAADITTNTGTGFRRRIAIDASSSS